ncbi:acyl-CoA dehydrogenase family protein [Streptomyces sp. SID8352]|uniref:acyl-CoA dehydrogenase family protein n=1 Tax=Streptomyces sp. SID8352 TaxID=2690338 RepID=UPI0013702890|nr:acyl-CoA dehydrogenase [Streptomyces sp. SID8352]
MSALTVAVLERALGDPSDPDTPFSYARCAELDRAEEFPEAICAELDRLGLSRHYVPVEFGGALTGLEELAALIRVVAGRDLTVAIGHAKSYLGAACVWTAGSPEQARALAARLIAGAPVSWGLTERAHGSDLMATEVAAEPHPSGGYRLTGEKWLINNATRGELVCVLARTDPAGGPRAHSLFLVDKRRLEPGRYRCLPKQRTHGIRGADISGIAFDGARIPDDALVGEAGRGAETVLRTLQLTRTVCTALSLGAADHALRQAVAFTAGRELYGSRLIRFPHVRRTLGRAHATLLACEAVSLVANRSAGALPGEQSVASSVVKSFVPERVDALIADCGELLGGRAFLTGLHEHGSFQKLARDHRVVGIFDGNQAVNRNALVNQFPVLARRYREARVDADGLARAVDPGSAAPPTDPGRLELVSRGGSSLVQSVPSAIAALRAVPGTDPRLLALAGRLAARCDALHAELAALRPSPVASARAFQLAEEYEECFAGAAVLHLWLAGGGAPARPELWRDGLWARAALAVLLAGVSPERSGEAGGDDAEFDALFDTLEAMGAGCPPESARAGEETR